nr:MAG TPA: hypothetical protein [Caudoviricetes sp.]
MENKFQNNAFVPQGKEKIGPKRPYFFNLYILKTT